MGKSYGSIRSRLNLCGACFKPIVDDNFVSVSYPKTKHILKFHPTAQECANADELRKDWYRQHDRTSSHYRTKA